jgi:hypothetical protein
LIVLQETPGSSKRRRTSGVDVTPFMTASSDTGRSASNQHPLNPEEVTTFQDGFLRKYENVLSALDVEATAQALARVRSSAPIYTGGALVSELEASIRTGIDHYLNACACTLVELGLVDEVHLGLAHEVAFGPGGRSSGGSLDYVLGRRSQGTLQPLRQVYLEAKKTNEISTLGIKNDKNLKLLAHLASGIDGLRMRSAESQKYCYVGAVFDGKSMLFGYTTKVKGTVHLFEPVITDVKEIVRHILYMIFISVSDSDNAVVSVTEEMTQNDDRGPSFGDSAKDDTDDEVSDDPTSSGGGAGPSPSANSDPPQYGGGKEKRTPLSVLRGPNDVPCSPLLLTRRGLSGTTGSCAL